MKINLFFQLNISLVGFVSNTPMKQLQSSCTCHSLSVLLCSSFKNLLYMSLLSHTTLVVPTSEKTHQELQCLKLSTAILSDKTKYCRVRAPQLPGVGTSPMPTTRDCWNTAVSAGGQIQCSSLLLWHGTIVGFLLFFFFSPAIKGMHINTQVDVLKSDTSLSTELLQSRLESSANWFSGFLPQIHPRIVYEFIGTAKTENI